ncbi:chalcone isomerase family protein [Tepidimonas charontis]|uniref:Uncharacterized protein n=1 Tax=Tepidimonas charontis TaxID=2267262 RepID=A0A554XHX1_9BURK|nr:chalcone isomerase family protein [Tepidimonas charontis]TSE35422.1 hypothetical protein Tchar_00827 [Tepidimonas charontis]
MSCSTRWSTRERWWCPALLAACLAASPAWANAADPGSAPAEASTASPGAASLLPAAALVGAGTLRFFGIPIYEARLYAGLGWRADALGREPIVLELTHARRFRGRDIARRSIDEMRRAGPLEPADEAAWLRAMQRLFPDVQAGDRIAGLWQPGVGARFVHTSPDGRIRVLGELADARFAERFFGIWLAATTSEPGLRQASLALPSPPTTP